MTSCTVYRTDDVFGKKCRLQWHFRYDDALTVKLDVKHTDCAGYELRRDSVPMSDVPDDVIEEAMRLFEAARQNVEDYSQ